VYEKLLVCFKSSLLLKIIYKCTEHYNYLETHLHVIQTNLQVSKLLKSHTYRHKVIKNAKLVKVWIKLKMFIDLGLMKYFLLFRPVHKKFTTKSYLQMYRTLQLFMNTSTFDTNKITSIEVIKNHIRTDTKLLKMRSSIKLGLNKNCLLNWA
jgi:hypothetical protein